MHNKKITYIIFVALFILITIFLIWSISKNQKRNDSYQIRKSLDQSIKPSSSGSDECGIESCHGLDITCGPNIPKICTEIYMAGDSCRKYISCTTIKGQCQLKKSLEFDNCKTCVENCQQTFPKDPENFLECESNCSE